MCSKEKPAGTLRHGGPTLYICAAKSTRSGVHADVCSDILDGTCSGGICKELAVEKWTNMRLHRWSYVSNNNESVIDRLHDHLHLSVSKSLGTA